jgi:hypothetical protein
MALGWPVLAFVGRDVRRRWDLWRRSESNASVSRERAPTLVKRDGSCFLRLSAGGEVMAELVAVSLENGGVIAVKMSYSEVGVVKAGSQEKSSAGLRTA